MKKKVAILLLMLVAVSLPAQQIKIACIGNSITSGASDPKNDPDTYSAKLQILMGDGFNVQNFGVSGRTILKNGDYPWWNEDAYPETLEFEPDIVTIMLGTNDSKPYNWVYKNEFMDDYIDLIDTLQTLASNPEIHLCLPPPAFNVVYDIRDSVIIGEIIPMIEQIAEDKDLQVIDFYTPFLDKNDLFPDDIHPNTTGNWEFAQVIHTHLTGETVTKLYDKNLAADCSVLTPSSVFPPGYLVDGDQQTLWMCNSGESVTLDLGEASSVDMFQMIFGREAAYQYTIESSPDNNDYTLVVDQSARQDAFVVAIEGSDQVDAQYFRFTFYNQDQTALPIQLAEIKILEAAPMHGPIMTYAISSFNTRTAKFAINIYSPMSGGYMGYNYSNSDGSAFPYGRGLRQTDLVEASASVRNDQGRMYISRFYYDLFEVFSDTLSLDYTMTAVEQKDAVIPQKFRLYQNYPNPFNPKTRIGYDLDQAATVRLTLLDCRGRALRTLVNRKQSAGSYSVPLDGSTMASGIYLYRLEADGIELTRQMLLVK